MSYAGYVRTFHDRDGRVRTVIKEAVNPQDIAAWIRGKQPHSQFANTECPTCGRNTTGAVKHMCP